MKTKTFTVKTDGFAGKLYEPDNEPQYAVLMVFGGATGMKMERSLPRVLFKTALPHL